MASLKKRMDNVLLELAIIRQILERTARYPPCCLIFHEDGRISCDELGPLPKEQFITECEQCRIKIKNFLLSISQEQKA